MGEKSQYITFDQIKLLVSKVEIIGVWKGIPSLKFRFAPLRLFCGKGWQTWVCSWLMMIQIGRRRRGWPGREGGCCKRRGYSGARRSGGKEEEEEDEDTDLQEEGRGGGGWWLLARRAAQVPQGGLHKVGKVMIRRDMDTIGKEDKVFIIDPELKSPKRPWNRAKG